MDRPGALTCWPRPSLSGRDPVCDEKIHADRGSPSVEQRALADFLTRGELDRHMRRMRAHYRRRRDALVEALADALPEATVRGIAAGLTVTVTLPEDHDEAAIRDQARRQRIELETMSDFGQPASGRSPALVLGYAQMPEDTIRAGIRELARAVRATRPHGSTVAAPAASGNPAARPRSARG